MVCSPLLWSYRQLYLLVFPCSVSFTCWWTWWINLSPQCPAQLKPHSSADSNSHKANMFTRPICPVSWLAICFSTRDTYPGRTWSKVCKWTPFIWNVTINTAALERTAPWHPEFSFYFCLQKKITFSCCLHSEMIPKYLHKIDVFAVGSIKWASPHKLVVKMLWYTPNFEEEFHIRLLYWVSLIIQYLLGRRQIPVDSFLLWLHAI